MILIPIGFVCIWARGRVALAAIAGRGHRMTIPVLSAQGKGRLRPVASGLKIGTFLLPPDAREIFYRLPFTEFRWRGPGLVYKVPWGEAP